jgi:hypothetical protein
MHTGVWWGDLRDSNEVQDLGVDGRKLKWIAKNWDGEAWLIGLAPDSDRWRAVVNEVTNFRVP